MAQERIQKILAHGGIASRRAAEQLIKAGRVRVNGRVVTELGTKANPRQDKVEVDGKRVIAEDLLYLVLHKPRGVVSTMADPEGRPTVHELLTSLDARVYPVGRLDFATSGVLLVTNDGELADGLLHPRKTVPKTYVLKVKGLMSPDDVDAWRKGVRLEDGMTLPADAKMLRHEGDKTWLELTIREGRNQQIRRMGEATGFPVMRLARLAFADISVEGLAPGRWRHLTRDELMDLKKTYGVPKNIPTSTPENPKRAAQQRAIQPRTSASSSSSSSSSSSEDSPPRFGGGSPGRRSYEVIDDWGGGAGRGSSSSSNTDSRSSSRGTTNNDRPRDGTGGGRNSRSRTTGTGGGIGSRTDAPRVKSRRGR